MRVRDAWYVGLIDRQTPGPRDDTIPLFAHGEAFAAAVSDLATRCEPLRLEVVAAIDGLGFAFGAANACRVGCGLILLRKAGKLPVPALRESFTTTRLIRRPRAARGWGRSRRAGARR